MGPLPGVLGRLYPGRVEEPVVFVDVSAQQSDAPPPFFERSEIRIWTGHNGGTALPTMDHDTNVIKPEAPESHRCGRERGRGGGYVRKYQLQSHNP